jgi:hypothetical protein
MIPSQLLSLANHLWQSTLFAAIAGLLAVAFRSNRAQIRYSLWLAASVKFLIPFSALVMMGSHFASSLHVPLVILSPAPSPIPLGQPALCISRSARRHASGATFVSEPDSYPARRPVGDWIRDCLCLVVEEVAARFA